MKLSTASAVLLLVHTAQAFAPAANTKVFTRPSVTRTNAIVDPSFADFFQQAASSIMLSADDVVSDSISSAVSEVAATMPPPEVAAQAADAGNGGFGFLAGPIEGILQAVHIALTSVGMSADAWGVSIIAMTVLIKLATYPLNKAQLESTNKMQVLQPTIKDIQNKYQSNPEVMNQKIAEVYQMNDVNPLAGCLPAFLQIPIFIGLYRAVLNLAKEDKLNEPFLWLPNLEGPTYGADPATANQWITSGWHDGVPSLGWDDTLAFLSIPLILVISQFISQALISPPNQTPEQANNPVLKLLPLLIGWFSINVPAALGVYWISNNIITTLLTLQIRSSFKDVAPATPDSNNSMVSFDIPPETPSFVTKMDKAEGFGSPSASYGDVKPITPVDAEIVEDDDVESESSSGAAPKQKKRGGKKKKGKK